MARLIILLVAIVLLVLLWRWLNAEYQQKGRPFAVKALLVGAALLLVALAATGRVHWIGAAAASLIAALRFALPLLLRSLPILQRMKKAQSENRNRQNHDYAKDATARMTEEEALAVLGLAKGASKEEIIEAHRRLIHKLHPDRGGNEFLATQLNRARDTLVG